MEKKKIIRIDLYRIAYEPDRTIGKMYIDGVFFGHTLEDPVRGVGIKIKGYTAIADGVYEVIVTHSPKYGEAMALISNVPDFEGIRFHGGNDPGDTLGCILIANNSYTSFKKELGYETTVIQGSLKNKFNSFIRKVKGWKNKNKTKVIHDVYIHIHNLNQ